MDEDLVDKNAHAKLLNTFGNTSKRDVRRELGISGDSSAAGISQDGNLSLNKLIDQSSNDKEKKSVASKLAKAGVDKALKTQATTVTAINAERSVDFSLVSNEVSEWEPLVKANRQAEKLRFPLDKEPLTHFATTSDIVKRSAQNPTSLEAQVYALLQNAGEEVPDKETGLTSEETSVLNRLDYAEALDRLKELRRHRILTSNQIARFKREKSIKSKKFKRLKTKYKMEKLQEELSTKGLNSMLRDRRIQERSSLRHRVTGKWDRKLAHYAKHEKSIHGELESKLQLNKKLTVKQDEQMSVEESDESEEEEWQVVTNKRGPLSSPAAGSAAVDNESSGSDSENLVDDVEQEEIVEYRKELRDSSEIPLRIGGVAKKKFKTGPQSQLHINPDNFLSAVAKPDDVCLMTSANASAIHDAFEDDEDLMEEMRSDGEDKPPEAEVDIKDFGWGSWSGPGIAKTAVTPKPNKRGFGRGRRGGRRMGYVVFNNVKNEKLAEHQLSSKDMPYAYARKEALEASLRQPVGPDFNTSSSFKSLIEGRIQKKVGVPITPISKPDDKLSSGLKM